MSDYINSEISRGVSKEEIKQKLLSQGWDEADIAEGMPNDSSKSSKLIPGIIIAVVLVGIIIGGFFFFSETSTEKNSSVDSEEESSLEGELFGCDAFPDKLDGCEVFSCEFEHLFNGEMMEKKVVGLFDGKCKYTEEMPNNGTMACEYSESLRRAVAQYHRDVASAESLGISVQGDLFGGEVEAIYTIDGEEVENPLAEALETGACIISGY
jgi:hypothetical protein